MLCSKCHKNEASVYFKQNINGEVREYALCRECAAEAELGFAPLNLFGSMFTPVRPKTEQKRCTLCSSTLADIKKKGKVGCAECYSVFADELKPMIENIHRTAKHCGRAPEGYAQSKKAENELDKLKKELKAAIDAEEYERAAELRDLIKSKEADNG
ncbi:MAG: UvrB/UvrC motif-containing protein [Clostridia bacterium]|nr:UvrB/UvrC motif-containing protein [Clostridia bacterium]